MEGWINNGGNYSKTFYSLLGASIGGIVLGGYVSLTSYFSPSSNSEKEKVLINKNNLQNIDSKNESNLLLPIKNNENGLNTIFENFENELKIIRNEVIHSPDFLSEDTTVRIISVIKEYADYLFEKRNKNTISQRRRHLANYLKLKFEQSSDSNKGRIEEYFIKYEEACGREFYDLYSFALTLSRSSIIKKIRLNKGVLESSWEKYSQQEEVYCKINYFTNIFKNLIKDEKRKTSTNNLNPIYKNTKCLDENITISNNSSTFNSELKIEYIENLFEEFSKKLIDEVAKLESELSNSKLTSEERDEAYANKLQMIKLRISDEMYIQNKIDDRLLKYLAINKFKIIQHQPGDNEDINNKSIKFKNLLEKINGIDLISIGL
jgi:hypothetical protein